MPQHRARDLLAECLNRIIRSKHATGRQLVAKGILSNGTLGRIRHAQDNVGIDVIDRFAEYLQVEPWQVIHPDPRVAELSAEAIEAARQLDTLADTELKRKVLAAWMQALEIARFDDARTR